MFDSKEDTPEPYLSVHTLHPINKKRINIMAKIESDTNGRLLEKENGVVAFIEDQPEMTLGVSNTD